MTGDSRRPTVSIASDDRARVPFAMIGALLLVTSVGVAVTLQTRPESPQQNVQPSLAMDRATASAQTALKDAVKSAARKAAAKPMTKTAGTPVGNAIGAGITGSSGPEEWDYADDVFRRYLRLRVYLQAEKRLERTGRYAQQNTTTTVRLPDVDYSRSSIEDAIDRVTLTAGKYSSSLDSGKLQAEIEGVEVTVRQDGEVVDTRTQTMTVTVPSTVFELHERTQTYENRLQMGFFDGDMSNFRGFGRRFAARVYPLSYAKTYYERIYAPSPLHERAFKSEIENYETEVLANDAIFNIQKNVYGTADPKAANTMKAGWMCLVGRTGQKLIDARSSSSGSSSSSSSSGSSSSSSSIFSRYSIGKKACQAAKFIYGGASGAEVNSVRGAVSKIADIQADRFGSAANQLSVFGGYGGERERNIEISNYADPAYYEVAPGSYSGTSEEDSHQEWRDNDGGYSPDGEVPNEGDLDVSDISFSGGGSQLDAIIDRVYKIRTQAKLIDVDVSGSVDAPEPPEVPDGAEYHWIDTEADDTYSVTSDSVEVDHDEVADGNTRIRRIHRYDIEGTNRVTRTRTWYKSSDTDDYTSEDNTATYDFEATLLVKAKHSADSNVDHKSIVTDYEVEHSGPPSEADPTNFEPALAKTVEELFKSDPSDAPSGASTLESNTDWGTVRTEGDLETEIKERIEPGWHGSNSNWRTVQLSPHEEGELKDWLDERLDATRRDINSEIESEETSAMSMATADAGDSAISRLKDALESREDEFIYRDEDAYQNVPEKTLAQARKVYIEEIKDQIETVEDKRQEAKDEINSELSGSISGESNVLGDSLGFAQRVLGGSNRPLTTGEAWEDTSSASLTEGIEYRIDGSPTYLSTKPVSRNSVPAVRPEAETASDVEDTFHAPLAARNDNHIARPGLPLVPLPTYWYASVNMRTVQVKGEYARFQVTATQGTPGSGPSTTYVRQVQPVFVTINGVDRRAGQVEAIDFESRTAIVSLTPGGTLMPKGSLGPGDLTSGSGHALEECSKTWDYVGPGFYPQRGTNSGCARSDAPRVTTYIPGADGTGPASDAVEGLVTLADDDDRSWKACGSDSTSATLARGGVSRTASGVALDDDDEDRDMDCPDKNLSVTFVNVGVGASIFVNGTDGQSMLIDTGSRRNPDGGTAPDNIESVIESKLGDVDESGPITVDYLVVTHNHVDHADYVDDIDGVEFENVYYQGDIGSKADEVESLGSVETLAKGEGDEIDLGDDDIEVRMYHPETDLWDPSESPDRCGGHSADGGMVRKEADCNAIVMSIRWGETKFVLPSDIRANTKGYLWNNANQPVFEGADVIQVAHHGSETSLIDGSETTRKQPDIPVYCQLPDLDSAVITNVNDHTWGPDSKVLKALADADVSTYWTGVHKHVEYVVTDGGNDYRVRREARDDDSLATRRTTVPRMLYSRLRDAATDPRSYDDHCRSAAAE